MNLNKEYRNYEKYPKFKIEGFEQEIYSGYDNLIRTLSGELKKERQILIVETYPGTNEEELVLQLLNLKPDLFINTRTCLKSEETLKEQLQYYLTEDRVFGKMYYGEVTDFMNTDTVMQIRETIEACDGLVILFGFGASCIYKGDLIVYCDLSRWEIQLRYRKGMSNYLLHNSTEDTLKKYKCGFFIEWRIADKIKVNLFQNIDYYIDTNKDDQPIMITGNAFRNGLKQTARRPFRTVPYFDPGVWGGQWMKEVCGLDRSKENYAWSFDGVPEENSLYLQYGETVIETPAINLVLYQPKQLLGEQVYARFGAEYPIRFDFLDTIRGQNLSLQVHPLTEYIHRQFGMAYTQDESYYILDAEEGAQVYLGIKEDVNPDMMLKELEDAQNEGKEFAAEKYINIFPAKKHDHFLIPAGTIHCSGRGCMVLEISATPYIFTFKLWDWGRLGLDGKPRPIHLQHGKQVIQWDRRTKWVKNNLVNQTYTLENNEVFLEEHTGLHSLEFIETRRYTTKKGCILQSGNTVNMLNLVDGKAACIESVDGSFPTLIVHYAETFIIPASIHKYKITPLDCDQISVIKAYVR